MEEINVGNVEVKPGEADALVGVMAENVITVVQTYRDRSESWRYSVREGAHDEPRPIDMSRFYVDQKSLILKPGEAVDVRGSGPSFPIFIRHRIILNDDGRAVDRRNSWWTRRQLGKAGVKIVSSTEINPQDV
jgi:hypothetical protein